MARGHLLRLLCEESGAVEHMVKRLHWLEREVRWLVADWRAYWDEGREPW